MTKYQNPIPSWLHYVYLMILVCLCYLVAGTAGIATMAGVKTWYQGLHHPSYTPPDALFGPVWTVLYGLMAVAVWRAWRADEYGWTSPAIRWFLIQLTLNFAWSFIFFDAHALGWGVIEISALWLCITRTTAVFWHNDKAAGWLMVPYLLWVAYALRLNGAFWLLN